MACGRRRGEGEPAWIFKRNRGRRSFGYRRFSGAARPRRRAIRIFSRSGGVAVALTRQPPGRRRHARKFIKKLLQSAGKRLFLALPKSHVPVVACRLAGIRTRGRSTAIRTDSRRRTGEPRPNGGRDLKQRRTGLFWSLSASTADLPKRLVFLAGRAERSFPSNRWLFSSLTRACARLAARAAYGAASERSAPRSFRFVETWSLAIGGSTELPGVSTASRNPQHRHHPEACSFWRAKARPSKGCRDDRSYP